MSQELPEIKALWEKILEEAKKVDALAKKRGIKDIRFVISDKGLAPAIRKRGPYNPRRRGSETQAEYEARISR